MKLKKTKMFASALALAVAFSACGAPVSSSVSQAQSLTSQQGGMLENAENAYKVVATSFHEYDWLREVIGDVENIELDYIIDAGVDLHSFQPSTKDIAEIASADLFVYNGGHSDLWVQEVLEQSTNEKQKSVSIMEALDGHLKYEVIVDGMEHDHDHDHDHGDHSEDVHDHDHDDHAEDAHDHDHDDHAEDAHDHDHGDHAEDAHDHDHGEYIDPLSADEHVWLSLNNAIIAVEAIEDAMSDLDPENAETYQANANEYIKMLGDLNHDFEHAVEDANRDTIMVIDRFPFLYMLEDYDIDYYAAFSGCSAETEASFETVVFMTEKINDLKLENVLILDGAKEDLAKTVIANSENKNVEILRLNSFQSAIGEDETYFEIMKQNLEVLKTALS